MISDNPIRPVIFRPENKEIVLIDQTLLPEKYEEIRVKDIDTLLDAIKRLVVRGAPALGIAGASGIALAAELYDGDDFENFLLFLDDTAKSLRSTRPTAVNLFYGINLALSAARKSNVEAAREAIIKAALSLADNDRDTCHAIGRNGLSIIPKCSVSILTHCNAGALACSEWGTALGVIRSAVEAGYDVHVYSCETRPLLQGARLTSYELNKDGIDVTVITDSMAAYLMQQKKIDLVIVGADRVVSDGVFNKIGTYMHAVCAKYHNIPFYVAAPLSTFDEDAVMKDITVEVRNRDEIAFCGTRKLVADGVSIYNPAFDGTPVDLITGIITEHGIFKLPDDLLKIKKFREGKKL